MEINFILNDREINLKSDNYGILLKYLREEKGLTGVKEGCGEGECGACSVLIGYLERDNETLSYKSVPSCLMPLREIDGAHIVTIEGLSEKTLNPVQEVFVEEGATQCGFCTPGFIVSTTGYLLSGEDDKDIIDAIDGHICRCTGYNSIKKAVRRIDKLVKERNISKKERLSELIDMKIIPDYFNGIYDRLKKLNTDKDENNLEIIIENIKNKKLIAGGTDILVQNSKKLIDFDYIFLNKTDELSEIRSENGYIYIGANSTVEDMKKSDILNSNYKDLKNFLNRISSTLIRNRATVAGNIVNASPIGDLSVILIALKADLVLMTRGKEKRILPIEKFFKSYKKLDLSDEEIIYEIRLPELKDTEKFDFKKVSHRKHLDIASVNSAVLFEYKNGQVEKCRISAGGVYQYPLYLKEISDGIVGMKNITEITEFLNNNLDKYISPIDDIRGSERYKRVLLKNLIISYFTELGE